MGAAEVADRDTPNINGMIKSRGFYNYWCEGQFWFRGNKCTPDRTFTAFGPGATYTTGLGIQGTAV